jgi:hypothetical protein
MRVIWKRLEKSNQESTKRIQEDEDNTGENNDKEQFLHNRI